MGFEELISDRDSEDELDEDLATVEDRRVLCFFIFIFRSTFDAFCLQESRIKHF